MQERQIDYVRVGKVKPRRKSWKVNVTIIAKSAAESLATVMSFVGIGCFLGIGFGGGLALVAALL